MKHTITGTTMPVLQMQLEAGEKLIAEPGEFSWMTENIQLHTTTQTAGAQGLFSVLGRALSGGGLFVSDAVFVHLESFALELLRIALVAGASRWQRWRPAGLLVSDAVLVHLESFALELLRVTLAAGPLRWLALLILRGVIFHFELFRHRVCSLRTHCWTSCSLAS